MTAEQWNKVLMALETWNKTGKIERFGQYLLNNHPEFSGLGDHLIFYAEDVGEVFELLQKIV